MMRANLQKHRVAQWALTALAGAVLTACGGSLTPPRMTCPQASRKSAARCTPPPLRGKGDTAATTKC